jgi:hypothetical protein
VFEDLPKDQAAGLEGAAASSVPTSEVSLPNLERLLRLALGRNLAHDLPPPFVLVQAVEAIGLDGLAPDHTTPAELIETALREIPDHDRAETIRTAHESVADGEITENWFEAGEDVDAILDTTESVEDGARAMLERCLPSRRAFWATQCARSALAVKDDATADDGDWRHFVLVGRDILQAATLSDIPLMQRIAEKSAVAHFMQR